MGSGEDITNALDRFEHQILTRVIFTSCPQLTIPSKIIEFNHLSGIPIHNSTLVSWPREAAIRYSTHPRFDSMQFRVTNLSEIPPGLCHHELTSMFSMWFDDCSLDVSGHGSLHHFRRQRMRLRSIPQSLGRLHLTLLWTMDTLIDELPDDFFVNFRLASLRLSRNAIRQLPEGITDTSSLCELLVDDTNVSTIPTWVFSWLESRRDAISFTHVSFAGSPVCGFGGELASGFPGFPQICNDE